MKNWTGLSKIVSMSMPTCSSTKHRMAVRSSGVADRISWRSPRLGAQAMRRRNHEFPVKVSAGETPLEDRLHGGSSRLRKSEENQDLRGLKAWNARHDGIEPGHTAILLLDRFENDVYSDPCAVFRRAKCGHNYLHRRPTRRLPMRRRLRSEQAAHRDRRPRAQKLRAVAPGLVTWGARSDPQTPKPPIGLVD